MNKVTLTLLMCLTISALIAQTAEIRSCEQIIANTGDGFSEGEMDQHMIAAVARCHVQMLDNLQAARWYEKIADLETCDPLYLMEYGQCLKSLKLYGKAKFYFQKYAQYHPVAGNQFMQSCDIAKLMLAGESLYQLTPVKWNSSASEYAPSMRSGKLIYNSWQSTSPATTVTTWNTNDKMQPVMNEFKDMGAISHVRFSGNGKYVVYSTNGFVASERLMAQTPGTKIYIAEVNGNDRWSPGEIISLCSDAHGVGYPSLSNDGTALFFASNMSGGQGGWDIYVSKRDGDSWSKPENLGTSINTPGNEISPFFADDRIYFSSDWHAGIGGFDVFVASVEEGKYGYANSVGYPVNSPKDDIDFVWDAASGAAYFSSNRIGGMGLYDLYKAVPQFKEIEVSVMHKENMKPVDNVILTMSPGNAMMYYTSMSGIATVHQPLTGEREIVVKKDGYKEQKVKLSLGNGTTQAYQVYLEPVSKPTSVPSGEVRVVQDAKPVNKTPDTVKPQGVSKPAVQTPVAKPVSTKEMYFIQIAALARNASLDPYNVLKSYGNLILHDDGMYAKVRVGTFATESEAKIVLSRIKGEGYKDAFVVKQIVSSEVTTNAQTSASTSEYKVRLGTYSKLANFNPDLVTHLGSIESYRKNELTIMLLAGYSSLTAAEKARDAAASQGFTDAYVVMDNGGIFERVRN